MGRDDAVTSFGQLPFFIGFLKQANLFDAWVADGPLSLTSPNAPHTPGHAGLRMAGCRPGAAR
jgi:hypothetical protein